MATLKRGIPFQTPIPTGYFLGPFLEPTALVWVFQESNPETMIMVQVLLFDW